jgi:pyruvate/2-oxoglutarate dehydrogenase complex dihydrolipoamide dehydrogenase (E3) component
MGIDVIEGAASFTTGNELNVNREPIVFEKTILCTGSGPLILPIEGIHTVPYLTNETIWGLRELPKSMLIIGGGPISLEIGQSLARFGCQVSIVEVFDRILP